VPHDQHANRLMITSGTAGNRRIALSAVREVILANCPRGTPVHVLWQIGYVVPPQPLLPVTTAIHRRSNTRRLGSQKNNMRFIFAVLWIPAAEKWFAIVSGNRIKTARSWVNSLLDVVLEAQYAGVRSPRSSLYDLRNHFSSPDRHRHCKDQIAIVLL